MTQVQLAEKRYVPVMRDLMSDVSTMLPMSENDAVVRRALQEKLEEMLDLVCLQNNLHQPQINALIPPAT